MRVVAVVLVLLLGAAGCDRAAARPAAPASTSVETVRVGDVERTYRLHVPTAAVGRTGAPVVIVLHGGGGNGAQVEKQTGFSDLADREGFLAVYPDGSGRTRLLTWNAGTCCGYARDRDVDDVGFLRVLIAQFPGRRVYVTGFSNGAMLAYRAGCELADQVGAIAPVSGAMDLPSCRPARPLPVYAIHGDADPIVPYDGGTSSSRIANPAVAGSHRSVAYAMTSWSRFDGCSGSSTSFRGAITTVRYTGCAADVRFDTVVGGEHAWPGGRSSRPGADPPTTELDATEAIWSFFATHGG
ncbi:alpha/beta hydrolase family esterase [Cryptosporangium phraense]|uniref:Polyhydroxybutyrate depolymerase n=1 Tax=Cryptosporangium phraense TaxID=2593070 RepID=A0A545AVN3_9ACTN|nr:PHB depolymerase family esterase [Cryptosporangium phraense]TQS45364.1 polyhydroxybutyrate depolymerase [Cryptosporangium phraense]